MNLLILQPIADLSAHRTAYRHEVAMLGAALRQAGHAVTLLLVGPPDEAALAAALAGTHAGLVLLYVEALAADIAFRSAGTAASVLGAPVIPFGPHARLCPDECLSLRGAEAVAVAPADLAVPPYLESRASSPDSARTPGFWIKCETGVMRNPLPRPPEKLDLPLPARDLYPWNELLDSAGLASIEVARGGEVLRPTAPDAAPLPNAGAAWPVLHRPVASVIGEMLLVADEQLDLGGWRVGNERWTAQPEWLAEFAPRYAREVALPLRTVLHAPDVTDEVAAGLARAGCEEVVLPVGSASAFIRHDILDLHVPTEAYETAFAALRRADVPSVARVEVGTPYETAITLDETAALLRRLDPDRVEAVLHFPAPGTRSYKAAKENGWLVPDPAAAHLAGRPALALRNLSAEDVWQACEFLPYLIHQPPIVPLLRWSRGVKLGRYGTLYDRLVKPFLAPPQRKPK